jgi:hypothetical protein
MLDNMQASMPACGKLSPCRCAEWAKAGECTKNKQFMVGEGFTVSDGVIAACK